MGYSHPVKIDLSKFAVEWPPFQQSIWVECETPITREEIKESIMNSKFQNPSVKIDYSGIWDISPREVHIARIAWLVMHWSNTFPIEIDFGVPTLGWYGIQVPDGNHRLLAAYYAQKPYVMALCCGDISEIEKYLYHEKVC